MLKNLTTEFLSTIYNDNSSDEEVKNQYKNFIDQLQISGEAEQNQALKDLTSFLVLNDFKKHNLLALIIGTLFENGYDSNIVKDDLIKFFERLLISASKLCEKFYDKVKTIEFEAEEEEPDQYELFDEYFPDIAEQFPKEAVDWKLFDECWGLGIALFSTSAEARTIGKKLRQIASKSADFHNGSHWFDVMLSVLVDEPFYSN